MALNGSATPRQELLNGLTYREYLASPEWVALRKAVLERDGGRCRFCGLRESQSKKPLLCHMSYHQRRGHEKLASCCALCRSCSHAFNVNRLRKKNPARGRPIPKPEVGTVAEIMKEGE